jgi:hypothetical protein
MACSTYTKQTSQTESGPNSIQPVGNSPPSSKPSTPPSNKPSNLALNNRSEKLMNCANSDIDDDKSILATKTNFKRRKESVKFVDEPVGSVEVKISIAPVIPNYILDEEGKNPVFGSIIEVQKNLEVLLERLSIMSKKRKTGKK